MISQKVKIKQQEEYSISPKQAANINELLQVCFPGYPSNRNYYRSLPTFRLLGWDKKQLIGHLAIVFRIIKIGNTTARIFGISDVCVHPDHRSLKIATLLLEDLEQLCLDYNIDFLILIAQNHSLYKKMGFRLVNNTCRWLLTNDHQSLGIMHGKLDKSLMVKVMGDLKWNKGLLDLSGGIF